jgi:6,7-dimethyl-8-ribityllumazine synthase
MAAAELAASDSVDCVAALGCVIRGETPHFGYVAESAALGILQAGLETGVPVTFGVLTCDDVPQAMARADLGGGPNKGADAALAALEMAALVEDLRP